MARFAGRFLASLGLVLALALPAAGQGGAAQPAPPEGENSVVKTLMTVELAPLSDRIFAAAGEAPSTPEGWIALEPDGRRLQALAQQLGEQRDELRDGRRLQAAAWQVEARALLGAADAVVYALAARDEASLSAAGEKLYGSCESCHRQFLKSALRTSGS